MKYTLKGETLKALRDVYIMNEVLQAWKGR